MGSLPVDDYRPEDHSLVGLRAAWAVVCGRIIPLLLDAIRRNLAKF